jgi:hypothetical protein
MAFLPLSYASLMISRIVSSFQHRISKRRRFQEFSNRGISKYAILETYRLNKPDKKISKSILILSDFSQRLRKAKKSGGWKKPILLPKRYYFWKVGNFSYWRQVKKTFYEVGGHSQNIKKIELRKYTNIQYAALKASSNSLNMYSFKINHLSEFKVNFDYTEAFSLEFSASYAFQHFIDHAIAYINLATPFLIRNPDIPILLPTPNKSFSDRDYLMHQLGIKNPVINTKLGDNLIIKNLYVLKALPKDILYSVPYELILEASNKICSKEQICNDVILIVREEKNRNYANLEQISNMLEIYCISKELNFKKVYPARIRTEEFAREVENCLILIGIHGGALCNLLSLPKKSYIFEFVPNIEGASLLHLSVGSGRKYLPIPVNFGLATAEVEIDLTDLKIALNHALNDLQYS